MRYTIDIDTGSTFTDGFFSCGDRVERVKVETTPHDLTVCFMGCIEEGSRRFGLRSAMELLKQTAVVRFSSTVGTNSVIQKTGPKLGLIVSEGFEDSLYDADGPRSPALDFLVARDMVAGIAGEIGAAGREAAPLHDEEIKRVTRRLLEEGARVIVVSLRRSALNPVHERRVKEIIRQEYPTHYLGTVTVLLASELTSRPGDALRTNGVLLNAYLHKDMVKYLYKADEDLRLLAYPRPLLVVHSQLGAARVARTTAISTCDAGPAAAMVGSASMSRLYGLADVVAMEIGGTTCDVGLIVGGSYSYHPEPRVQGIPVNLPVVDLASIGSAGGSIVRVDPASKRLEVGPISAGARPGPACFDLGGTQATALDADVVLGYVNPDYFLGGRKRLNRQRAERAIRERVAAPLGVSVEEAARRVRRQFAAQVGERIEQALAEKGRAAVDFALFSYGGSGGLFCADIARRVGIGKVYTFVYSSVFGAFGSSTMDIVHQYERSPRLGPRWAAANPADIEALGEAATEMRRVALRDAQGEGFEAGQVSFALELELREGDKAASIVRSPKASLADEEDVLTLCEALLSEQAAARLGTPGAEEGIVPLAILRLVATCPVPHHTLLEHAAGASDPAKALKGSRLVHWDEGSVETPVYERRLLGCGDVVAGPAIVEAEDSTYAIPAGRKYSVDKYLNGVIEES
ncbi:MAG: hydantoinase/oxoprolinase family protein [Chloroflexota bacterium]|nr:MAG: hydantoinase/oxoprolinase family protein [Chloroflexota bacterium]